MVQKLCRSLVAPQEETLDAFNISRSVQSLDRVSAISCVRSPGNHRKRTQHLLSTFRTFNLSLTQAHCRVNKREKERKKVKLLNHVQLFVTPWTVAYHVPLSMGISREEYWSVLPFPSPGDLPNPGIEPGSPT